MKSGNVIQLPIDECVKRIQKREPENSYVHDTAAHRQACEDNPKMRNEERQHDTAAHCLLHRENLEHRHEEQKCDTIGLITVVYYL